MRIMTAITAAWVVGLTMLITPAVATDSGEADNPAVEMQAVRYAASGALAQDPAPINDDAHPVKSVETTAALMPSNKPVDLPPVEGASTQTNGPTFMASRQDKTLSLNDNQVGAQYLRANSQVKADLVVVGVTWDGPDVPKGAWIRQQRQNIWGAWESLDIEDPGTVLGRLGTEATVVAKANRVEVALQLEKGQELRQARLSVVDPGKSSADNQELTANATQMAKGKTVAITNPPLVYTRADWGADESLAWWKPGVGEMRGAVIHHTAGSNDYQPEDVPGIIRGIYRYHAVSLGWGDIGYNVLVDKYGRAWQGRAGRLDEAVPAAHALGLNAYTFGISVLGNYTNIEPTPQALDAVAKIIAWKFAVHGVDARGTMTLPVSFKVAVQMPVPGATPGENGSVPTQTVWTSEIRQIQRPTIMGHRDTPVPGGGTSCPGQAFYNRLDSVRELVANTTANYQQGVSSGVPAAEGRIAGSDRISTAAAVARAAFPARAASVYLARADVYADALVAGALADGPVLLVNSDGAVPAPVQSAIDLLSPARVVALGGTAAVSDSVLQAAGAGRQTVRLGGKDRVETALAIAEEVWNQGGKTEVYVASSLAMVDAVAGGVLTNGPIVLIPGNAKPISAPVTAFIKKVSPKRVVGLGGTGVLNDYQLRSHAAGVETARIWGADRYGTAAAISYYQFFAKPAQVVYVARGDDPVDALAAGALTAGPVLLVPSTGDIPAAVANEIKRLQPKTVTAVGGEGAVSSDMLLKARQST